MIASLAYAQDAAASAPSPALNMVPLVLMIGVFYFILIRPEQKKRREHQNLLSNLKRNDRITTTGGLHGRVVTLADDALTIEIAAKVQVKIDRSAVQRVEAIEDQEKERTKS